MPTVRIPSGPLRGVSLEVAVTRRRRARRLRDVLRGARRRPPWAPGRGS